jgi:hypothetical protein
MDRHFLGLFERAPVGEVSGDPGGTERVATRPASRPRCLTMARRCLAHNFQAVWYGAAIRALCWTAAPSEVKFAAGSLLEEAGFEPLVPRRRPVSSCCRSRSRLPFGWCEFNDKSDLESLRRAGTDGSNPSSSVALLQTGWEPPGVGSLAFRDHVWRGSASYATQKAATVRPVDPPPGRQWKLLKISVSESMLSPSLTDIVARQEIAISGRPVRQRVKMAELSLRDSICSVPIQRLTV